MGSSVPLRHWIRQIIHRRLHQRRHRPAAAPRATPRASRRRAAAAGAVVLQAVYPASALNIRGCRACGTSTMANARREQISAIAHPIPLLYHHRSGLVAWRSSRSPREAIQTRSPGMSRVPTGHLSRVMRPSLAPCSWLMTPSAISPCTTATATAGMELFGHRRHLARPHAH